MNNVLSRQNVLYQPAGKVVYNTNKVESHPQYGKETIIILYYNKEREMWKRVREM